MTYRGAGQLADELLQETSEAGVSPTTYSMLTPASVLDAQLEALALGSGLGLVELASLSPKESEFSEDLTDFSMFKKGPNSLIGTGSSIASASDHEVSSSDFESDSGIENCHVELPSPEAGKSPLKSRKKGVEHYIQVMPHDDLAVTASVGDQSEAAELSRDQSETSDRIDSFIKCLDHKVSINWSMLLAGGLFVSMHVYAPEKEDI